MKVLVVCPTYPPNEVPCGVGDFTGALVRHLVARGAMVTVAASRQYRGSAPDGVRVVPIAERWDRRAVAAVVALANDERSDVVNVQYTPELYGRGPWIKTLPASLALRGRPVVITPHTLVGGYASARWLAPLLVMPARRLIAPNHEVARLVGERLPMLRARVREIPIGSNIPLGPEPRDAVRARVRASLGLGFEASLVAHFGFAYPGKGIETLLDAARRLDERGLRFRLLMIGGASPGAGDYYAAMQAKGRKLGLDDLIHWTGHASPETVDAWLAASDVHALPYDGGISARRGTLVAGLARGLPTVSTHPETADARFRDGDNVLLVPARDPGTLAEALARVLASPALRASLGAGAAKLAPEFSWDAIADATLAVYREAAR